MAPEFLDSLMERWHWLSNGTELINNGGVRYSNKSVVLIDLDCRYHLACAVETHWKARQAPKAVASLHFSGWKVSYSDPVKSATSQEGTYGGALS